MKDIVLNIQINSDGIKFFNDNHETIVIIKPFSINDSIKVACASFPPFPGINQVTFIDDWYEYTSLQSINEIKTINMQATQKVDIGKTYTFNSNGFNASGENGVPNKYGLFNSYNGRSSITCGLAQSINVNNNKQISVVCVNSTPLNQATYFEPNSIVWIMAASQIATNMAILSNMLKPNNSRSRSISVGTYLEIDINEITTIYFDENTNLFQKGSLPDN